MAENATNPLNFYNIGAGMAALPFLYIFHFIDVTRAVWLHEKTVCRWASIYPLIYLLGNITYGCGALYLTGRGLRQLFSKWLSGFAVWACVLCGPALYYFFADIAMSHLPSAFFVSLTFLLWLNWREGGSNRRQIALAFAAGTAWGFSLAIRPYNLPLGVLFLERAFNSVRRRDTGGIIAVLAAGSGAFLGFVPQLLAWKIQHGTWLSNKVGYEFHVVPPFAGDILFSRTHGLFFWHPLLLISCIGLVAATVHSLRRLPEDVSDEPRGPSPALVLLLVFTGIVWMYGNWHVWWLGVSFGMRGFVDFFPIFAFGFAAAASFLSSAIPRNSARSICRTVLFMFFLLNLHLYVCFRNGIITVDGPLYWSKTVNSGDRYTVALLREWWTRTDFDIGVRAHLLVCPPDRSENKFE